MTAFKLNPQQQEAVDTIDGALLLLAGAGTGKTRVIVQRTGKMLQKGIPPSSILAVTFTNKAAKEMKERIAALVNGKIDEMPTISTFHSFCSTVLKHHANLIGFTHDFTLATDGYRQGLIREIANELNLTNKIDPSACLYDIGRAKADLISPQQFTEANRPNATEHGAIFEKYQERLKYMNMMDFDDLLCRTVELWDAYPKLLLAYQNRFRFLMIDEYQDTNHVQLEIMVRLAGERQNICAVGDDDQSIYGWRGASQENILQFESFFPNAKVIRLEQNYRSTNTILKAANAVISHNTQRRVKNLWSANGDGEKIKGVLCKDEKAEATFVVDTIRNLVLSGPLFARKNDWKSCAVLYRATSLSRMLEKALREAGIPFTTRGSQSFYERKEILDLLSMLELAANPKNDMAFKRIINVPPKGIGDATLVKLDQAASITHQPLLEVINSPDFAPHLPENSKTAISDFIKAFSDCNKNVDVPGPIFPRVKKLIDDLHYIEKLPSMYRPRANAIICKDNIMEFLTSVGDYDLEHHSKGTLGNFIQSLLLQEAKHHDSDSADNENAVNLMTVHAAKGLEYPNVFIIGFEQGLFPHQMAMDEGNLDEERRLCYVAITRAKLRLFISYAEHRKIMNTVCCKKHSQFLNEIPDDYIEYLSPQQLNANQVTPEEDASVNMEAIMAKLRKNMDENG